MRWILTKEQMANVIFGGDWTSDLPSPENVEWEDVKDQVDEEVIDASDEDSDAEEEDLCGIILTHIPTSLSASADEYGTKNENRELARDRIMEQIVDRMRELKEEEDEVYPESEQMEGFNEGSGDYEDRWTPPDPDNPPWDEESDL